MDTTRVMYGVHEMQHHTGEVLTHFGDRLPNSFCVMTDASI